LLPVAAFCGNILFDEAIKAGFFIVPSNYSLYHNSDRQKQAAVDTVKLNTY
jgi:hypothetical protein